MFDVPYLRVHHTAEAEFLYVIGTQLLRVILFAIHSHLYYGFYSHRPTPPGL